MYLGKRQRSYFMFIYFSPGLKFLLLITLKETKAGGAACHGNILGGLIFQLFFKISGVRSTRQSQNIPAICSAMRWSLSRYSERRHLLSCPASCFLSAFFVSLHKSGWKCVELLQFLKFCSFFFSSSSSFSLSHAIFLQSSFVRYLKLVSLSLPLLFQWSDFWK